MSDSRNDISKIIEEINRNSSLIDSIRPSAFESITAELIAKNASIMDVARSMGNSIDYVARIKDSFGAISTIGIEAKQFQNLIDASSVAQLAKNASALNLDAVYLATNSSFTVAAREAAKLAQIQVGLFDRPAILDLIDQYKIDRNLFTSSLFDQSSILDQHELFREQHPTPEQVEELDIDEVPISEEQKTSLILVDRLPLTLISRIMQNPNEVRNITPRQFEEFVADLVTGLGFRDVVLTPKSGDGGKDVIATYEINGIPLSFYFECKKYAEGNKIQLETLRSLLGTVAHESHAVNKAVLVTTSKFTKGSKEFILSEARLDGKDYDALVTWINQLRQEI